MKFTFLKQKVYHDGVSMIVRKAGEHKEVPAAKVALFIEEGVIDPDSGEEDGDDGYRISMKSPGRWVIEGPGIPDGTIVTGKKSAAEQAIAEVKAKFAPDGAPAD